MTRRLTLHVGQSKAGSTSLQNWLESGREALLAQGVLFPASVLLRRNPSDPERTPGHLGLSEALGGKGEAAAGLAAFEAELAAHPGARLILSIENLFSDQLDAALERMGAYFHDWEVEILAVLRPQLDWLRSRHRENVMSGGRGGTEPLPAVAQAAWESGALDYRRRLQHLAGLLGAKRVRALRFDDAAGRPLVPRLLEALALAPDTGEQVAQIHANRRERDDELLEAKRRLNGLIRPLSPPDRLRIEHALRQAARETAPSPDAPQQAAGTTGLDPVQLAVLQAGNDALLAEGILDQPLDTGRPDPAPARHARRASPRTHALFDRGLALSARIAWQEAAEAGRPVSAGTLPGLTEAQIEALGGALRRHPVSLHLEAEASALLAAAEDGALSVLLLADPAPWARLARLDAIHTASPLLALAAPPADSVPDLPDLPDLPALLQAHHLPPPGLLVVGADCPPALALAALARLHPAEVFLWPRPQPELVEALCAPGWSGYAAGDALLARRRAAPLDTERDREQEQVG